MLAFRSGAAWALCIALGCGSAELRPRSERSSSPEAPVSSAATSRPVEAPATTFDEHFDRAERAIHARRDAEGLELLLWCIDRRGQARSSRALALLTTALPEMVEVLSRRLPLARRLIGDRVASLGEVVIRGPNSESMLGPPSDRELPTWLLLNLYLGLAAALGDPSPSIAVLERCVGPPRCAVIGELATVLVDTLIEQRRVELLAQLAAEVLDHHIGVEPTPEGVTAWNAELEALAPKLHYVLLATGREQEARALADKALRAHPRSALFAALVASAHRAGARDEAARIRGVQRQLEPSR